MGPAVGDALSKGSHGIQDAANAAASMAANTLPELTLKMAALQKAQEKYTKDLNDGGTAGTIAKVAVQQLGNQMDIVRSQQSQLSANVQLLTSNFGISKTAAQGVAQAIGINLTQALSKTQMTAFAQQVQQMGLNATTTGGQATTMAANVNAALLRVDGKPAEVDGDVCRLGPASGR